MATSREDLLLDPASSATLGFLVARDGLARRLTVFTVGVAAILQQAEALLLLRRLAGQGTLLTLPPNGSRLSCGRRARWRKELERQKTRLASEATQFLPTGERPAASSAC